MKAVVLHQDDEPNGKREAASRSSCRKCKLGYLYEGGNRVFAFKSSEFCFIFDFPLQLFPIPSRFPRGPHPQSSQKEASSLCPATSPESSRSRPTCPSPGRWREGPRPRKFWLSDRRETWTSGRSLRGGLPMGACDWSPAGTACSSWWLPGWPRPMRGFTSATERSGRTKTEGDG